MDIYSYPVVFIYVHRGDGGKKTDRMIPQDRLALSKNSDKCDFTFPFTARLSNSETELIELTA